MTPKPRAKNTNLPKYCTLSNGRIVYRPRIAPEHRHIIPTDRHGYLRPPVRLGKPGDPEREIIAAYLTAKNQIEQQIAATHHTLAWVVNQYTRSSKFKGLAPCSQRRAQVFLRILDHPATIDGEQKTLGDIPARSITRPMVRRLADQRLKQYQSNGKKGVVIVNREITTLASAIKWAKDHIDRLGIVENPFGIEKYSEQPNTRYVTDEEYHIQRDIAAGVADYLPVVFELAYLLAGRSVEMLDIKLSDIDTDRETGGIHVTRRKGSESNIIEWSDRLYQAYQDARELHARHKIAAIDAPLLINQQGQALRIETLRTAMSRLKKKMAKESLSDVYWSLHKLKSKGVSDAQDDRIAGHKSESMRNRYRVKTARRKPAR
jgi:integrase